MNKQPLDVTCDLNQVRYDVTTGLVPVVVQDADSGAVLTVAYANREALKRTIATGQTWFWSRSRQEFWHKGATSGNVQHVIDIRVDCDADAVLYIVHPMGPACHTGETSCFYRSLTYSDATASSATSAGPDTSQVDSTSDGSQSVPQVGQTENPVQEKASEAMTVETGTFDVLSDLWKTVDERFQSRRAGSYTTYLFEHGAEKIGKKLGEEGVEVALAALRADLTGEVGHLPDESADLLYHLLVLWRFAGLHPETVMKTLAER